MTLLLCPFCGSAASSVQYGAAVFRIKCTDPDCDARGGKGATSEEAAAKWNRRASYAAHLPAVMAATEPEVLERPLPMAGAVEPPAAPCLTCRYVTTRAGRHACRMVFDSGVWHYRVYSGALVSDDGLPTDRTMRCPGWAAKETT